MQDYKETLKFNYRDAIVNFLKEESLEYSINDENPNIIKTQIECKPANAKFPLGIALLDGQMLLMVTFPPMPVSDSKRDIINDKLKEINKGCHLLDFTVADNGITGGTFLNIFAGDDANQVVRNSYLVAKDDLEKSWLPIAQAVFTNDGNYSALAQFKRIIESDKETINLTIEENTSFSGRRFNGRLLGYTYALVDTRSHGQSSISEIMSFKEIPTFLSDFATEVEVKAIENLLLIVKNSKLIGSNTDMLLGQIEGLYAFVHQLSPSLLYLDNDISLGDKVIIEGKEKYVVEEERVELKELTFEDIRSALLKWDKSLSEVKSLCLRSGMDTSKAQILIDKVCSKIKEECNRKMKPYLLAMTALIIVGIGLCITKMHAIFIVITIIVFLFCIQKIYSIYKQYRIKTS